MRYTGRLGGGRRGLAPPIEIVVLEVLIRMQVTGFSLKSIVFELFAFFYFGPAFDKTLGGAGGEEGGARSKMRPDPSYWMIDEATCQVW